MGTSTDGRPIPIPTFEDREFWTAAGQQRLVLPRCRQCGHVWFPPYRRCPKCLSEDREWIDSTGRGVLVGVAVFHRQYLSNFEPPYNVAIVRLDEGPEMYCNVVGISDGVIPPVDLEVEVEFVDLGEGISLPQFRPRALG